MPRLVPSLLCAGVLALTLAGGTATGQAAQPVRSATGATTTSSSTSATATRTGLPAPTTGLHLVTNLHGAVDGPRKVGFTLFDTGSSLSAVQALPAGVKAMVWLGQKCPTPATAEFRSTVSKLASSGKVYGYYLSDEPHIADCPQGPAGLASRAAYVDQVSGGRQKTFIVLSKAEDYRPFRPAASGVSMVGLDPYPCSVAHPDCQPSKIDEKVNLALTSIRRSKLVPVYQGFGQTAADSHYYNLPTASQMRTMLEHWTALLPSPPMDYTYGWGHQSSSNPTLVDSAVPPGRLRRLLRRLSLVRLT